MKQEDIRMRKLVHYTAILCLSAGAALAADRFVTKTVDDGTAGTLRYEVDNSAAGDTIKFNLSSYPAVITLIAIHNVVTGFSFGGPIDIAHDLNIAGPGPLQLSIVPGQWDFSNFVPFGFTASTTNSVSGFAINNFSNSGYGIIVADNSILKVTNMSFSGNGEGIYMEYTAGKVSVSQSTFSNNVVSIDSDGGLVTISQSLISGGERGVRAASDTTIINSTVTGTTSAVFSAAGAVATIINSTIAGNTSCCGDGVIFSLAGSAIVLKNTLLANNTRNCDPSVTSSGYNFDSDGSCGLGSIGDISNNPNAGLAAALANNGGPTQTFALLPTSPAVNVIPTSPIDYCSDINGNPIRMDQRGFPRPVQTGCEIGAYELGIPFSLLTGKLGQSGLPTTATFDLITKLTLGKGNDGIDPVTETVLLTIGNYNAMIPPGSFKQLVKGSKNGGWVYGGTINGVPVSVVISPLGGSNYQFKASGGPANIGSVSPVLLIIAIGDDAGSTTI